MSKQITIPRDNAPSLQFVGKLICHVSSKQVYNDGGRHQEISLYKTDSGKFIVAKASISCWQGESDCYEAEVCADFDDVRDYVGQSKLAHDLYAEAGINNVEIVE